MKILIYYHIIFLVCYYIIMTRNTGDGQHSEEAMKHRTAASLSAFPQPHVTIAPWIIVASRSSAQNRQTKPR